jgi:hypothetical protein
LSGSVYLNLPETRVSLLKFGMWKKSAPADVEVISSGGWRRKDVEWTV